MNTFRWFLRPKHFSCRKQSSKNNAMLVRIIFALKFLDFRPNKLLFIIYYISLVIEERNGLQQKLTSKETVDIVEELQEKLAKYESVQLDDVKLYLNCIILFICSNDII